jgi:hypothetical protein
VTADLKVSRFYRSTGSFKAAKATPGPTAFGRFGRQWRVEPRLIGKSPREAFEAGSPGPRKRSVTCEPSHPELTPAGRGRGDNRISSDEARPAQPHTPPLIPRGLSRAGVRLPIILSPFYTLNRRIPAKSLTAGTALAGPIFGAIPERSLKNTASLIAGITRISLPDVRSSEQRKPEASATPVKRASGLDTMFDSGTGRAPRQPLATLSDAGSTRTGRIQTLRSVATSPPDLKFPRPIGNDKPRATKHLAGHSDLARGSALGTEARASRDPGSTPQSGTAASVSQPSSVSGELWLDTLSLRDGLHSYLTGEALRSSQARNQVDGAFAEG